MAVLQYICVVDDEMYPRIKQYAHAEVDDIDPRYDFLYRK